MIKLTADEQKLFQNVGRQYPEFVQVIERWRVEELERLPVAPKKVVGVMQGRTQALTELKRSLT